MTNLIPFLLIQILMAANSETAYRSAIRSLEKSGPSPELADALTGLANFYFSQAQYERAEALCRKALVIERALESPRELEIARELNNLASALSSQGKAAEASRMVYQSLEIYQRAGPDARLDMAFALNTQGVLEMGARRYAHAERVFQEALEIWKSDPNTQAKAAALGNLGKLYSLLQRHQEAQETYRRAMAISKPDTLLFGALLCGYADALASAGKKAEGRALRAKGRNLLRQSRAGAGQTIDVSDFH